MHHNIRRFGPSESFFLGDNLVTAGCEREESVGAIGVRFDGGFLARGGVGQGYPGRGNNCSGTVKHLTGDSSAILSIQQGSKAQQQ